MLRRLGPLLPGIFMVVVALISCRHPQVRPGCKPLAGQWEQTSYPLPRSALEDTTDSLALVGMDGAAPPPAGRTEATAEAVERCLERIPRGTPTPWCYARESWQLDRGCIVVLTVPGVESCTDAGPLLPDLAPEASCDGKPPAPCPCRWRVATQDYGRTVVVPEGSSPAEGLLRAATGCRYPWAVEEIGHCIHEGNRAWSNPP